jgi:2-oxoglutarate dehydrogenase E2 component (dihydrolipoamide succinyltransferase)
MSKVDVIMPQMGESIAEGTLTKWLKQIGDAVDRDEDLFEISTDKVDADIPSPVAGTLVEILVEEGATVEVNTVVARIDTEGGAAATAEAPQEAAAEPAAEPAAAEEPLLPEQTLPTEPVAPAASSDGPAAREERIQSKPRDTRGAHPEQVHAPGPQDRGGARRGPGRCGRLGHRRPGHAR